MASVLSPHELNAPAETALNGVAGAHLRSVVADRQQQRDCVAVGQVCVGVVEAGGEFVGEEPFALQCFGEQDSSGGDRVRCRGVVRGDGGVGSEPARVPVTGGDGGERSVGRVGLPEAVVRSELSRLWIGRPPGRASSRVPSARRWVQRHARRRSTPSTVQTRLCVQPAEVASSINPNSTAGGPVDAGGDRTAHPQPVFPRSTASWR